MIGWTNTSGGGLNIQSNKAVIHVTAPAGSTISFEYGGIVVAVLGPKYGFVNADESLIAEWYYSVSLNNYGMWTITATRGSESATDSVTVSANAQYDVTLVYEFWIHKAGSGLMNDYTVDAKGNSNYTFTSNADEISLTSSNNTGMVGITKPIDMRRYRTCTFEYIRNPAGYTDRAYANTFYLSLYGTVSNPYYESNDTTYVTNIRPAVTTSASTWASASIDVSSINNEELYFKFVAWNSKLAIRNLKFVV